MGCTDTNSAPRHRPGVPRTRLKPIQVGVIEIDHPSADATLLFSGLTSTDFAVADVSSTIIPQAARIVLSDVTTLVENEVMNRRTDDSLETRFYLKHKYLADTEFTDDLTVTVDDVIVFDSPDYHDVSGTTLTVSSIDTAQGFVTMENAQSGTIYATYRYSPVRISGTGPNPLVKTAVMYKACELMWDAIIGSTEYSQVGDYRTTMKNKFRERYMECVRRINAFTAVKVKERTKKLKGP